MRAIISLISLAALLRSGEFAYQHFIGPVWLDSWHWVRDFQLWDQGRFTFHDLIKPYAEHRIVTTRLVFLLDALLFHMNGRLPVIVSMALFAAVGVMMARLARRGALEGTAWDVPPLFFVALACSVCQVSNIIFPFQVQFAFMLAGACVAAVLLAAATEATGGRAAWLAAAAALSGVVSAFSMASGILLTPALLVLLALRRARALVWAAFAPLALLGVLLFFHHYGTVHDYPKIPLLDWQITKLRIQYVGNFYASALNAFPAIAAPAGWCALGLFLVAGFGLLRRTVAAGAPLAAGDAALLALGLFVAACGPAGTLTPRIYFGAAASLVSRYGTVSLLFAAVLIGLYLRWAARANRSARLASFGLPVAAAAILLVMNVPFYDRVAGNLQGAIAADTQLLVNDVGIEGPAPEFFGGGIDDIRDSVALLRARRLNMFSAENGPPAALLARLGGVDANALPACRGAIDEAYAIDDSAFLVSGWATDEAGKHSATWIVPLDAQGAGLGSARVDVPRPDVGNALRMKRAAYGFSAGFRAGAGAFGDRDAPVPIRVTGWLPGAAQPLCRLPEPALIGPVLIEPMAKADLASPADIVFSADGFVAARVADPGGAPAWRAAPGAGGDRLAFDIKTPVPAGRAIAVPFHTVSAASADHISFIMADGTRLDRAVPAPWYTKPAWRAAVVTAALLARHGGVTRIEVVADAVGALIVRAPLQITRHPDWSRLF